MDSHESSVYNQSLRIASYKWPFDVTTNDTGKTVWDEITEHRKIQTAWNIFK